MRSHRQLQRQLIVSSFVGRVFLILQRRAISTLHLILPLLSRHPLMKPAMLVGNIWSESTEVTRQHLSGAIYGRSALGSRT
jgi:hypothetical protein